MGSPSLLYNHLKNSIEDVNSSGNFNYLVICLDTDDDTIEERNQQVKDFISKEKIELHSNTKLVIITQNKCIETWFLANPKIFKNNPNSSFLVDCINHYNVKNEDPELMDKPIDFEHTTAIFHSKYFQEVLAERKLQYSKKNPEEVTKRYFLEELIKRNKKTNHIKSFREFIDFCHKIEQEITENKRTNN